MTLKYKGEEALALLLMEANIPFRREYQFYNQRKWRFDFAIGNCQNGRNYEFDSI